MNPTTYLTVADVCALVRLGRSRLYSLAKNGRFPASLRLPSGGVRWREHEVRSWIESGARS